MKKVTALLLLSVLVSLVLTPSPARADVNLLTSPWSLSGSSQAKEAYQIVSPSSLLGQSTLRLDYNLHGTCLKGGDASAIVFEQSGWKYISLSNYGQNCKDGSQTVVIPLTDFGVDTSKPLDGPFHIRVWSDSSFTVEVTAASLSGASAPSTAGFSGLANGQNVTGTIFVQYTADPAETQKVTWYVDNNLSQTDTSAPYWLGGYSNGKATGWNTSWIPAISHELKVVVTKKDNSTYSDQLTFAITRQSNTVSAVTPTLASKSSNVSPTPIPTAAPVVSSTSVGTDWSIQSIDSMKSTKDAVCGQRDLTWIDNWLDKAKELGANYVAISMPYDNPTCADSTDYANRWIQAIRSKGLHVWHRRMPLAFEGIYSTPKAGNNFLTQISNYIIAHPDQYQSGDIFTPIPEPQNGGISGFSSCNGYCQFSSISAFNSWLRDAITRSNQAFSQVGISGIKVGYFGFDGFVTWGDNNPDWHGILEDSTIQAMGNIITIDHYPEAVGENMDNSLTQLETKYPTAQIVIGEWGTITGGDTQSQVISSMGGAKKHPHVIGFNYWQFGPEGSGEQLINESTSGVFTNNVQFNSVQSYYTGKL